MILGALAVSTAVASAKEQTSVNEALARECDRYGLDYRRTLMAQAGEEFGDRSERRRWWDFAIVAAACGVFVFLAVEAQRPALSMSGRWMAVLAVVMVVSLIGASVRLHRQTRFS